VIWKFSDCTRSAGRHYDRSNDNRRNQDKAMRTMEEKIAEANRLLAEIKADRAEIRKRWKTAECEVFATPAEIWASGDDQNDIANLCFLIEKMREAAEIERAEHALTRKCLTFATIQSSILSHRVTEVARHINCDSRHIRQPDDESALARKIHTRRRRGR
jgi:hypothetical protein